MRLIIALATLALAAAAPVPQDCDPAHCSPVYTQPVEPPICSVAMRRDDVDGGPVWVCPTTTHEAFTTWVGWSTLPIPTWTYTRTTATSTSTSRSSLVHGPIPIPTRWYTLPVTLPITRSRITKSTTARPTRSLVTGRPVTRVPVDPITLTAAPPPMQT